MPTYEYECQECGHNFERFQNMSDKRLGECPECGGKIRRLIGRGAGVIFKGSSNDGAAYAASRPSCGRDRPCCGRDEPCGKNVNCT